MGVEELVKPILLYYFGANERVRKKAEKHLDDVEWTYDGRELRVEVPSASTLGKRYTVIVDSRGEIVQACGCKANKQGRKCWHMYAAAHIYQGFVDGEPKVGRGARVFKRGQEALEHIMKQRAQALEEPEPKTRAKLDLSPLSPTLKTLERFVEGLTA